MLKLLSIRINITGAMSERASDRVATILSAAAILAVILAGAYFILSLP